MKGIPFARFMEDRKVSKTLKLLENANKGGILPLIDEIFEVLLKTHPKAYKARNDTLLEHLVQNVHSVTVLSQKSVLIQK